MSSMSRNERRKEKFEKIKHPTKQEEKIKWSKNSIVFITSFGISLILTIVIATFNSEITSYLNLNNNEDYSTTKATVYSYEIKTIMEQTRIGNSTRTIGYIVNYRYKVNGKVYDHEETLSMWTKSTYLTYIWDNLNTESFLVQYDIRNPDKANLVQKE